MTLLAEHMSSACFLYPGVSMPRSNVVSLCHHIVFLMPGLRRTRHTWGQAEGILHIRDAAAEDVQSPSNALLAQHVVAVGWDVDLVQHLLAAAGGLSRMALPLLQHLLLAGLQQDDEPLLLFFYLFLLY